MEEKDQVLPVLHPAILQTTLKLLLGPWSCMEKQPTSNVFFLSVFTTGQKRLCKYSCKDDGEAELHGGEKQREYYTAQ